MSTLASRVVVAIAAVLLVPLLAAGCVTTPQGNGGGPSSPVAEPTELQRAEVREYEGSDLSSVEDFRENSIEGPQKVDRNAYRLSVGGLVGRPLTLAYDEVLGERERYKKVVRLDCVEGWGVDILWEGVKVSDLLEQAEADPRAQVVIFRAVDGYSTSLPRSYIEDRDILLAYKMNDVELPPERGFPFQLVAEDRWGYKWIKWVESIEVSDDTQFKGYWESRGYSNDGERQFTPR